MSAFTYTYIAILIEINKTICIKKYLRMVDFNDKVLKQLANDVIGYRKLKQKFDSTFSVFPFLWWSYLFIGLSGNIKYMQSTSSLAISDMFSFILEIGLQIGSIFLFNYSKNYFVNGCQSVSQRLADKLFMKSFDHKSNAITILKQELMATNYYTALGLFPLDNSLILSFSGAVISFTVMCLNF